MIPSALLWAETILIGLICLPTIPMWAIVPMALGAREGTPRHKELVTMAAVFTFWPIAIGCLIGAWNTHDQPVGWVFFSIPLVHLAILTGIHFWLRRDWPKSETT